MKKLDRQMLEKYGFCKIWFINKIYETSPINFVNEIREKWDKFTEEEKAFMSGVYTFKGGLFEIRNENGKCKIEAEVDEDIITTLGLVKCVPCNVDSYKKALRSKKLELTPIEREFMKNYIIERENEKSL